MRDDIGTLHLPRSARRYARMSGLRSLVPPFKQELFTQVMADLVNRGKTRGFRSRDAAGKVRNTLSPSSTVRGIAGR